MSQSSSLKSHTFGSYVRATLLVLLLGWAGTAAVARGARELASVDEMDLASTLLYEAAQVASGEATAHAAETMPTSRYYIDKAAPLPPTLDARGYVLADLLSGDILLERNADVAYPIASVSKLTTALVALEHNLATTTWLYPLLLESNNEMAETIASSFDRKQFMTWMNERTAELGMLRTSYRDASGISPRNMSSAADLLILVRHIYTVQPQIFDITRLHDKNNFINNNLFVKQHTPDYLGGKSGFTPEAGGTLVSLFNLTLENGEVRPIAIIILGTDNKLGVKYELARSLIDYLTKYVSYL